MTTAFTDLKKMFENRKNIIRVEKNKENPYLILNKTCINDISLSWAAKGLHTYLMSLPDDWTIYVNELVTHTSVGRDHTYKIIKELLKFGYMERIEYRFQGKVLSGSYTVYETPIDVSNLDNTKPRIINVYVGDNGQILEKSTIEPNTENPYTVNPDTDFTKLLNNNTNNKLNTLNNNFDDDDTSKLINLYKSFKLEKRVMPHSLKLLKENTHISLEVFEQVFINASEDSVVKKYKYIKEFIEDLNLNKVTTLEDFDKYNQKYKESKTKSNKDASNFASKKQKKSKLEEYNDRCNSYISYKGKLVNTKELGEDLNKIVEERNSLNIDFNKLVKDCMESEFCFDDLSPITKEYIRKYIKENYKEVPKWIQ